MNKAQTQFMQAQILRLNYYSYRNSQSSWSRGHAVHQRTLPESPLSSTSRHLSMPMVQLSPRSSQTQFYHHVFITRRRYKLKQQKQLRTAKADPDWCRHKSSAWNIFIKNGALKNKDAT